MNVMWEDPIVAEVRQARLEIEQECATDFHVIYQRAFELQKKIAEEGIFSLLAEAQEEALPVAA